MLVINVSTNGYNLKGNKAPFKGENVYFPLWAFNS